jgi:hypothetical protein
MPCQIQGHFGFKLDEQDNRDFELDRSHGKLTNGSSDLALDGAKPQLTNCRGNASGRPVGSEIDPFPQLFHYTSCFKNWGQ